jgi:encore-like protein
VVHFPAYNFHHVTAFVSHTFCSQTHYKFPPMSSYNRMIIHRCAAYFGMDHNIESTGKCVVVNKTKNTRIPNIEFKEHIKDDVVFSEEPRRSILKRDSTSMEDYNFKSPDRQYTMENRRSKSFEEREEEYAKVRRRIFNREVSGRGRQLYVLFQWVRFTGVVFVATDA